MPTRYLKSGICDSDSINALSDSAECLFYRLLVTVDDFGRSDARPLVLKAKCYPIKESVDAAAIENRLHELEQHGLIKLYFVDGKPYLQMQKWDSKPRAGKSKFPEPQSNSVQVPYIYVHQSTDEEHLHTYVKQVQADEKITFTVLPETETETETDIHAQSSDDVAQKSETPSARFDAFRWLLDHGVAEPHARDWLKVRKAKRAANTETAFTAILTAADHAGWTLDQAVRHMAEKSWQSFRADWVGGQSPPGGKAQSDDDSEFFTTPEGQRMPMDFARQMGFVQ